MVAILWLFSVALNAMTKRPQEEIRRESESPINPFNSSSYSEVRKLSAVACEEFWWRGWGHVTYSKVIGKVNHTEKRGRLPVLKYWSFLGTRVISLEHLGGPPCRTRDSLETRAPGRVEEDVWLLETFPWGKRATEVMFAHNAAFSGCFLELYKWWLSLASGRTRCPSFYCVIPCCLKSCLPYLCVLREKCLIASCRSLVSVFRGSLRHL